MVAILEHSEEGFERKRRKERDVVKCFPLKDKAKNIGNDHGSLNSDNDWDKQGSWWFLGGGWVSLPGCDGNSRWLLLADFRPGIRFPWAQRKIRGL